ncbi:MAG: hypothetical protein ACM3X4_06935 [Ignavibacteriales bacterium]
MNTEREQFTIRVSKDLLDRVREEAAAYGDSMNDLVVAAVEKEVSMRRRLRLMDEIDRERLELGRRGPHPDSTPVIRELRMGTERHD